MKKCISLLLIAALLATPFTALGLFASENDLVTATIYENGMENWNNSPNAGTAGSATQILFCPKINGAWSAKDFAPGLPVTVTMTSSGGAHTFEAQVATVYDGGDWGICRIEPCLLRGVNKFLPEKNVTYTASFTFEVNGALHTVTVPNYRLDRDPVDPTNAAVLNVRPLYGEIENYRGKTCFIVGGTTPESISPCLSGESYLTAYIRDDTVGKTYTISRYAFDDPATEVYSDGSFVRLAVCEYGIVPVKDHVYTVALEIRGANGSLLCGGVSYTGAFDSFNDAFLANGPIVPQTLAHKYDEYDADRLKDRRCHPCDPDHSGRVDIGDVSALLDLLSGKPAPEDCSGDVNGDLEENIHDVTDLLDVLAAGYVFDETAPGARLMRSSLISGEVSLPEKWNGKTVASIGDLAFAYAFSLERLTLPASVAEISPLAFIGCDHLEEVIYGGTKSAFLRSGAILPEGCRLTCLEEEDPIDGVDVSGAIEISDLSGYDGILRVKTTGELLFSPTFNELRALVKAGASYEDYTAYLRFTDEFRTYPSVAVDPVKSKGGWVDFFLQGDGIDCGFCPTAGVTYEIELTLVGKNAPDQALYHGVYTATASSRFEESPYYVPTPVDPALENAVILRYKAGQGGAVSGAAVQMLEKGALSEPVRAVPLDGYAFAFWSDGVTTPERADVAAENAVYDAVFVPLPGGQIAGLYLFTESGNPILTKEYENATLLIRGADNEKYNVTLPATVKGRGNSSWNGSASQSDYDSKNSYGIKLPEKAQLLGIGDSKSKKWVLNANKFDASGLRNFLVWDLADRMGNFGYVTDNTWVQLYVNNEYRGMYMLTEKIDTGKDRVNVNDDPTGNPDKGYLMELDFRGHQEEEDPWFDIEGYGPDPAQSRYDAVEFVIKSDIEGQQDIDFIRNYVQNCHNAIMSGDRAEIEKLVDLPSLIDMYIIEELSKDCDAGRASFYVCKDAGGKLCFTAPWDFDFGFGTYGPARNTAGLVSEGSSCCTWFASLITRAWFREAVLARMTELDAALGETLEALRTKGAFLKTDADMNAAFWNIYGRNYHGYVSSQVSLNLKNYDEHIGFIVDWTSERWANLKTAIAEYN